MPKYLRRVLADSIAVALPLDSITGIEGLEHRARLLAIFMLFLALMGAFALLLWLELRKPYAIPARESADSHLMDSHRR